MKERRKEERKRLLNSLATGARINQYLMAFKEDGNEFLGYLMDISSQGAMLLSKCSIDEDQQLRLRVELPKEVCGTDELLLSCKGIWCEKDVNPEYFRVGFLFTETVPQLNDVIKSLTEETTQPKSVGPK
jgi:hypothetical protein